MSNTRRVDGFIKKADRWGEAFSELRRIIREFDLTEDFKWMHPCYTLDGKNIVLMHGFNEYCALLFHKGVLIDDPDKLLIQQTKNVQSARQLRFTSVQQILDLEPVIKDYIQNAIEVEEQGLEVELKGTDEFEVAEEFQIALDNDAALKDAFEALTPGRQRGYLLYFSGAKRADTRAARVEKCIPRIMDGLGLND